MAVIKAILVFAIFKNALAGDDGLLHPCEIKDMDCLSETTQNFLERTSAGIPEFNIKPIDPLVIPELSVDVPEFDLVFHFKNLTVTGLKAQKISDFKLDKSSKSVVLQTRVEDAHVVSDITVALNSPSKAFSGKYFAKTTVVGTSRYNYELKPNKEGVEYFDVGPETVTCEALGAPEVTLDEQLTKVLADDPDTEAKNADYTKKATEVRKTVMSQVFAKAYVTVIHNIRAAAKVFPKTAFFKDI